MRTSPSAAFTAAINNNKPPVWRVIIGSTTIPADRIPAGSVSLKMGTSETGRFSVGAVVVSEFSFSVDNNDGAYDSFSFDGKKVEAIWGYEGINQLLTLGEFYVDDYRYSGKQITVTALDKLRTLDKSTVTLTYPTTVDGVIAAALDGTGITKTGSYSGGSIAISSGPEYAITRRQALSYALQLSGNYGRMDYAGRLLIAWYDWSTPRDVITDYWGRDLQPKVIHITGAILNGESIGATGYQVNLGNNPFFDDSNKSDVSTRLLAAMASHPFLPGSIDTLPNPLIEPGDVIVMPKQHSQDTARSFVVTSMTLRGGLRMSLTCDAAEPGEADDLRPSETKAAIQDAVAAGDIGGGGGGSGTIENIVVVYASNFDGTARWTDKTLIIVLDDTV